MGFCPDCETEHTTFSGSAMIDERGRMLCGACAEKSVSLEELERLTEKLREMPRGLPEDPEVLEAKIMAAAERTGADPVAVAKVLLRHPKPPEFVAPTIRFEAPSILAMLKRGRSD